MALVLFDFFWFKKVLDIGKNRGRLSEVCQDGRLIWLPRPSPYLVELTRSTEIGEREPVTGMLVVPEACGSKPE